MSYTFISREDMEDARSKYQEARTKYSHAYFNFLTTVLDDAGVLNKLVKLKGSDLKGQFKVSDEPYLPRPWTIKFFPVRKTYEGISMKSKNIPNFYPWNEDTLVQQLKDICEVVGDLP